MAITFVSFSGAAGTGAVTPALPSGLADNDIYILTIEGEGEDTSADSPPTGGAWTAIDGSTGSVASATDGAADRTRNSCYWAVYTAASPPNRVVPDAGNHTIAVITVWRGVDTTTPIHKVASSSSATNNTSVSITAASDTTVDGCMIVATTTAGDNDGVTAYPGTARFSSWANANLASITEAVDVNTNAGSDGSIGIAYGILTTAGAIGTTTATNSLSEEEANWCIALLPAVTGDINNVTITGANNYAATTDNLLALRERNSRALSSVTVTDPLDTLRLRERVQTDSAALDYSLETIRKRTVEILNNVVETDINDFIIAVKSKAPNAPNIPADPAVLTDNHIELRQRVRLLQDALELIDAAIELRERNRLAADSITATDASVGIREHRFDEQDSITATDDHVEQRNRFRLMIDTLEVTDLALIPAMITVLLDSLVMADSAEMLRERYRILTDSIELTDLMLIPAIGTLLQDTLDTIDSTVELRQRFRLLFDSIVVEDFKTATYFEGSQVINNVTLSPDLSALLDFAFMLRDRYRLATDSITTVDNSFELRQRIRLLTDSIASQDAVIQLRLRQRLFADTITATDANIELRQRFRVLLDTIEVVDSIVVTVSGTITRTLFDSIEATDDSIELRLRHSSMLDLFNVTDTRLSSANRPRQLTDSLDISDTFDWYFARNRIIASNAELTDSVLATYIPEGILIQMRTLLDYVDVQDFNDAIQAYTLTKFAIKHRIDVLNVQTDIDLVHMLNKLTQEK